jgi:hypothetical protein
MTDTSLPTISELDAALADAIAAELRARRAGISDDQVAAMNLIHSIREQIEAARRRQ